MRGAEYVAVRRISNKANETLAAVGDTCERVPEHLLEVFERRGVVRRVPAVRRLEAPTTFRAHRGESVTIRPKKEEG